MTNSNWSVTYLAFFHFEQTNAIAQQLQIFLGPFASDLGCNEFSVQSCIVIILVRSQVHLIELGLSSILGWTLSSAVVICLVLAVVWGLLYMLGVH